MKREYVLGLDLGVASIGWACLQLNEDSMPISILDQNVVVFTALDNDKGQLYNVKRREKRGTRRILRRKKERLKRVKALLVKNHIITQEDLTSFYHEKNIIQKNDALELKVKGLIEKLTNEELARVLIHYAKHRGFKSNRKNDVSVEDGKMKMAIAGVQNIMKENECTVSKAIILFQKKNGLTATRNKEDKYDYGFERKDVENEINLLLDKQIEFSVVDNDFKEQYLAIWSSQRDFSDGPADSPFSVEFSKMFGFCKFRPEEKRISRAAPSFELFSLIQKLQNLRYYVIQEDGSREIDGNKAIKYTLTKEQIATIYSSILSSGSVPAINYKYIQKVIGKTNVQFINLPQTSRKQFIEQLNKYKKKHSITQDANLTDAQYNEVKEEMKQLTLETEIAPLKSYKDLRAQLNKLNAKELLVDIDYLDDVATILSYAQTDDKINKLLDTDYKHITGLKRDIILDLKIKTTLSGSGSLCLSLTKDLIKEMLDGATYDIAMKKLVKNHVVEHQLRVFKNGFPTIEEIEDTYDTQLTQPNVKHVLVILRKLYNAIVAKHGEPKYVHIEVARDIRNSYKKRNEIQNEQIKNQLSNQAARVELAEIIGVSSLSDRTYRSFSNDDLIKYRLWKEQGGICMYTGEVIDKSQVLDRGSCEVDHILPFSRTFDDSYQNKVLVIKKANQEKKNKTPYEWLKSKKDHSWNGFKERVNNCKEISQSKKEKLLWQEEINVDEFTRQSLHATSYVSKLAVSIFKDLLHDEEEARVKSFKGGITSFLRKYYKLNHLTHSLESESYDRSDTEYKIIGLDDDKPSLVFTSSIKEPQKASVSVKAMNQYGDQVEYKLGVNYHKDRGFSTHNDETLYSLICHRQEQFKQYLIDKGLNEKSINTIDDHLFLGDHDKEQLSDLSVAASLLIIGLRSEINKKNRNNHFHHIIDAALVASMTLSMQLKITKFKQLIQNQQDNRFFDADGEQLSLKDIQHQFNLDNTTIGNLSMKLPVPYPTFIEELTYKVFERDEAKLKHKLLLLQNPNDDVDHARVKYPYRYVDKRVSGSLHEDTIYGLRKEDDKEVATIRKSVRDANGKVIDIEKIYDKEKGQKKVYEVIKEWISLNKPTQYPMMNGFEIKKVKLKDDNVNKMIQISPTSIQKGYAKNGDLARIELYKKVDSDKLYFVQIPIVAYNKIKNKDYNFDVQVWWGQATNNEVIKYADLASCGYQFEQRLYPGQPIFVKKNDGSSSICSVTGFSSGMFEVNSIVGDGIDLIVNSLFMVTRKQWYITISTIESIKPVSMDILGNLKCRIDN